MAFLMEMAIAGITFSVGCAEGITLKELPPVYKPFVRAGREGGSAADLHIDIETGPFPDIGTMTRIFDTDYSWSMFSDERDYVIALNPSRTGKPTWLLRIGRDLRKGSVFCGDALIHRGKGATEVANPLLYPLDQILFIYLLAERAGALFHASGAGIGGGGYMFPGRSGAGKSTLSRQLALRDPSRLLSDERVVARKIDGGFGIFGTPWAGEADIASNGSLPLKGIFFLHHGDSNRVRDLSAGEAIEALMPVTSVPWYDKTAMTGILSFCEDLVRHVPAYELHFRPDEEVVDFLETFLS